MSTDDPRGAEPVGVRIDRDLCMGSGNCVYWGPDVFDLDDAGLAIVAGDPSAHPDQVALAVENCPTQAISTGASTHGG